MWLSFFFFPSFCCKQSTHVVLTNQLGFCQDWLENAVQWVEQQAGVTGDEGRNEHFLSQVHLHGEGLLQGWHETVRVIIFFSCLGSAVCIGCSCSQLPCPRGRRMPASTTSLCDAQSHIRTTAGQHGPPFPYTCYTQLWLVASSLSPDHQEQATAASSWMAVNAVMARLSIHLMASIELSSWIAFVSPFLTLSFIAVHSDLPALYHTPQSHCHADHWRVEVKYSNSPYRHGVLCLWWDQPASWQLLVSFRHQRFQVSHLCLCKMWLWPHPSNSNKRLKEGIDGDCPSPLEPWDSICNEAVVTSHRNWCPFYQALSGPSHAVEAFFSLKKMGLA